MNECNTKAVEITSFTRQEVLGRDLVQEFITEEYRESVRAVLDDALRGKETANFEFALYTKDKRRVDVLLNATTRISLAEKSGRAAKTGTCAHVSQLWRRPSSTTEARTSER